jgi:hypothetical protein
MQEPPSIGKEVNGKETDHVRLVIILGDECKLGMGVYEKETHEKTKSYNTEANTSTMLTTSSTFIKNAGPSQDHQQHY